MANEIFKIEGDIIENAQKAAEHFRACANELDGLVFQKGAIRSVIMAAIDMRNADTSEDMAEAKNALDAALDRIGTAKV